MKYDVMKYGVMKYGVMKYDVKKYNVMKYDVMTFDVMKYNIMTYDIWHISQPRTPEDSGDSQVKEAECWADSYDGVQFHSCSAGESLAQSQVILIRKC